MTSHRHRHRTKTSEGARSSGPMLTLVWTGRLIALLLIAISPWNHASASWESQFWIVIAIAVLSALAIAVMFLTKSFRIHLLGGALVGLVVMALIQQMPLPEAIWRNVAPAQEFEDQVAAKAAIYLEFIKDAAPDPNLTAIDDLRSPRTLSLHPVQTAASTTVFAAAVALLLSCGALFTSRLSKLMLLSVIGATALSNAFLGLVQSVSGSRWTLLEMPFESYFSTFVSRNSAPQFYAVGIGALIGLLVWWSQRAGSDDAAKKYTVRYPAADMLARLRRRLEDFLTDLDPVSIGILAATTFIVAAILAASSRGGIIAGGFAALITLGLSLGNRKGFIKSGIYFVTLLAVTTVLLTSLDLDTAVLKRMETVHREAFHLDNGRIQLWQHTLANSSLWLTGCGLGNFHFAILNNFPGGMGVWYYHAESIYLELFAEFGLMGCGLAVAGLFWLLVRIRRSAARREQQPMFYAVLFPTAAIGLQSLADFSLILPGVFVPYCAILGTYLAEVGNRKSHSHGPSRQRRRVRMAFSTASWCVLGFAVLSGLGSLRGFALAEHIEIPPIESESLQQITLDAAAPPPMQHPELNLQYARSLQSRCEAIFRSSELWPVEISEPVRNSLSQPDKISAALRGTDQSALGELKRFAREYPEAVQLLEQSARYMAGCVEACPMDWRASWGLLRSDTGVLSPLERARNYARLALLTDHHPQLQKQIASVALLTGAEFEIGFDLWQHCLSNNAAMSVDLAEFIGPLIPVERLRELLPPGELIVAKVARAIKNPAVSAQVAATVDTDAACRESSTVWDWELIDWLAQSSGDQELSIVAMTQAARMQPLNHTINFRLAKLKESIGDVKGAIQEIETAIAMDPINVAYKKFRIRLLTSDDSL